MFHVVVKDYENSGFVWDAFYCQACLEKNIATAKHLEILQQHTVTPEHLSRIYPPLVDEPVCENCGTIFNYLSCK